MLRGTDKEKRPLGWIGSTSMFILAKNHHQPTIVGVAAKLSWKDKPSGEAAIRKLAIDE